METVPLKLDLQYLEKDSPAYADPIEQADNPKILLCSPVGPAKNQDPHAGSCKQTCQHLSCTQDPAQVHLSNDHRTGTVRDHSHQAGQQDSQHRLASDNGSDLIFSQDLHQKSDQQCHQKNKQRDLKRVDHC